MSLNIRRPNSPTVHANGGESRPVCGRSYGKAPDNFLQTDDRVSCKACLKKTTEPVPAPAPPPLRPLATALASYRSATAPGQPVHGKEIMRRQARTAAAAEAVIRALEESPLRGQAKTISDLADALNRVTATAGAPPAARHAAAAAAVTALLESPLLEAVLPLLATIEAHQ